jgi:hypothetical protein
VTAQTEADFITEKPTISVVSVVIFTLKKDAAGSFSYAGKLLPE